MTNILMKQNQKAQAFTSRILRDRKGGGFDAEEYDMMMKHQQQQIEEFDC